jgi:hypothetical protein
MIINGYRNLSAVYRFPAAFPESPGCAFAQLPTPVAGTTLVGIAGRHLTG